MILNGLKGLLSSRKGTLCLLVLTSMSILAALSKIDGMAFAAGCSIISSIYCFTQHRADIASMQVQFPPRDPNVQ